MPFTYRAGQVARPAAGPDGEFTPYSFASSPAETVRSRGLIEFLVKVDGSTRFGARASARCAAEFPFTPERNLGIRSCFQINQRFDVSGARPATPAFAPLRSMIRHALDTGVDGDVHAVVFGTVPREFAYLAELARWPEKDS